MKRARQRIYSLLVAAGPKRKRAGSTRGDDAGPLDHTEGVIAASSTPAAAAAGCSGSGGGVGGTTEWTQEDTWTSLSALLDAFQRTVVVKQPAKRTPLSTTPGSSDHRFLNLAPVPLALLSHLRHQLQQQRQADVEQHMLQLGRQRWIRCFPCPLAHSERLIVAMGPLQDFMAAEAARLEWEGEVAAAKCLLAVAVWWAHGPCSSDIQVNKKTLLKAALHLRVVAREATCDALPAVLGLPHSWCEVWSKLYPTLTDQPARSMARHLLRSGWLLSTATGSLDEFWWSLPGCGPFIRAVTNGRKAVVAAVRKTRYAEVLRSTLEAQKGGVLKDTPLSCTWHVSDALAQGLLQQAQSTSGPVVSLGIKEGGRIRAAVLDA